MTGLIRVAYEVRCLECGVIPVPGRRTADRVAEDHMKGTQHAVMVTGTPVSTGPAGGRPSS